MKLRYRLGLDLGTNSIGWCMHLLDEQMEPIGIRRLGVRVFADGRDPKTLGSLAATRRLARQMRRRRDRLLKRKARFLGGLVRFGLFPQTEPERQALQVLDPYELRKRALDAPLTPYEIGRALFHLVRRRGFRSSRRDARSAEEAREAGKVMGGVQRLQEAMRTAGARTLGEHLAGLHSARQGVRARRRPDGEYVLYLHRAMIEHEFDAIWAAQSAHHPGLLTEDARAFLRDALLFQRRLRPIEPGKCQFERSEPREPLASPLQQKFRMLQEVNHLRVHGAEGDRPLSREERDRCLAALGDATHVSFAQLRRVASLPRTARFTIEADSKRKGLAGDRVGAQLGSPSCLGSRWEAMNPDTRRLLALTIEREDRPEELAKILAAPPWRFDDPTVARLASVNLPEGYGSLSRKALEKIVPELEQDVVSFDVAVKRAGYGSHSSTYDGELQPRLPYYGELLTGYTAPVLSSRVPEEREFGRIPNPTVHIGLNQLRLVVNELIRRFGHPAQIVIELAREFGLSAERRRKIMTEQADRQGQNEEMDAELQRLGQRPNRENRTRMRLYRMMLAREPMGVRCVYSGEPVGVAILFSSDVEIDHVLPFSRSLHDGIGNKVLCKRKANRDKGNRTPFEAFGHNPPGYDWAGIVSRAEALLGMRQARSFREKALDEFLDGRDFLDRQLTDTQYFSRVAREYLIAICPPPNVWVTTGRLTGLIRAKLGLNDILSADGRKNRDDHRHHAVDAAVIGLTSRSLIKRVADAAARAEHAGEGRVLAALSPPWPTFRSDLADHVLRVYVSHRVDHGVEGALHNETNYGMREEPSRENPVPLVSHRIPLESMTASKLDGLPTEALRKVASQALAGTKPGKEARAGLAALGLRTGMRRVQVTERLTVIPITDRRNGKPYRFVKGNSNYCYDIWRTEQGRWDGRVVSRFEANQRAFRDGRQGHRSSVMRLIPGDIVAIEDEGRRRVMRVTKISEGVIALAEHHEANVDARNRDKDFDYTYLRPNTLRGRRGRPVGIDVLGYLNDPGFRDDRPNRRDRER